jgi:ribosomal-protein-alanine N-acetyltransferase
MTEQPSPAGIAHAAALAAIHAASFPPDEQWDAAAIATQLGQPGVFALLHRSGGMVLARVAADEAEILTIAVLPAMRQQGLGRALLLAAHARAAEAGARTVYLEVSPANTMAQAMYRRLGYTEIALRRRYYPDGSDAVVLACGISRAVATDG